MSLVQGDLNVSFIIVIGSSNVKEDFQYYAQACLISHILKTVYQISPDHISILAPATIFPLSEETCKLLEQVHVQYDNYLIKIDGKDFMENLKPLDASNFISNDNDNIKYLFILNHGGKNSFGHGIYFSYSFLRKLLLDIYCEKLFVFSNFCYSGTFTTYIKRVCIFQSEADILFGNSEFRNIIYMLFELIHNKYPLLRDHTESLGIIYTIEEAARVMNSMGNFDKAIAIIKFLLKHNDIEESFTSLITKIDDMLKYKEFQDLNITAANLKAFLEKASSGNLEQLGDYELYASLYDAVRNNLNSVVPVQLMHSPEFIESLSKNNNKILLLYFKRFLDITESSKIVVSPRLEDFPYDVELISSSPVSQCSYRFSEIPIILKDGTKIDLSCGSLFVNAVINALLLYPDNGKDLIDAINYYYTDITKKCKITKLPNPVHFHVGNPEYVPLTPYLSGATERGLGLIKNVISIEAIPTDENEGKEKQSNKEEESNDKKIIEEIIRTCKPGKDGLIHKSFELNGQKYDAITKAGLPLIEVKDMRAVPDNERAPYYKQTYNHMMKLFSDHLVEQGLPEFNPYGRETFGFNLNAVFYNQMIDEAQEIIDVKFMAELEDVREYFLKYIFKNEDKMSLIKELFITSVRESKDFFMKSKEEYYKSMNWL